jgi:hypothetical protein
MHSKTHNNMHSIHTGMAMQPAPAPAPVGTAATPAAGQDQQARYSVVPRCRDRATRGLPGPPWPRCWRRRYRARGASGGLPHRLCRGRTNRHTLDAVPPEIPVYSYVPLGLAPALLRNRFASARHAALLRCTRFAVLNRTSARTAAAPAPAVTLGRPQWTSQRLLQAPSSLCTAALVSLCSSR